MTLRPAVAVEGKNNNKNDNPLCLNVKCWKNHAVGTPSSWNNSHNLGRKANFKNINISGKCGGSSDINATSHNSNIVADDSIIISGSLSGRGLQRQGVDLARDPVVTLNYNGGDQELPTTDVTGVPASVMEKFMVSGIQNDINNGSSSNIAAIDDSMRTIEQTVPTEGQDLPTTMKPAESKPTNKEIVIGTWNIQSGRSTRLETALQALNIVEVDLCFLTETKLTNGIYTRFSLGYWVLATNVMSHHQGGIALVYKESPYW